MTINDSPAPLLARLALSIALLCNRINSMCHCAEKNSRPILHYANRITSRTHSAFS